MYDITAEVYTKANQFHYVKVCIDGVYISGIKVCASKKYSGEIWIQMPSYKNGGWKRYIEMSNDSALGQEIYRAIEELTKPLILGNQPNEAPSSNASVEADPNEDDSIDLNEVPF